MSANVVTKAAGAAGPSGSASSGTGRSFPTAFTILFGLIAFVAVLTWIVPAGQYNRVMNEQLKKEVPVPGTYHAVASNPQRLRDVLLAPIAGMYDPKTEKARAIDVALFVLVIGGFLAVVTKTGAIDAGIGRVTAALRGREIWMIPILMALFALGGTKAIPSMMHLRSTGYTARRSRRISGELRAANRCGLRRCLAVAEETRHCGTQANTFVMPLPSNCQPAAII